MLGPGGTGRNRLDGHFHLDTAIETVEDGHQPINGEADKMSIADTRKLAGLHADQSFGLYAFQKKSKTGIKTSKQDVDLIKQRYAAAKELAKHEQEKPQTH